MATNHNTKPENLSRRRFLRNLGIVSAAGALASCGARPDNTVAKTTDHSGPMTMRLNPNSGDKVSLLGYGCMRFPTIGMRDGTDDNTLDQEAINRSIDYAMEHGVNYYDTSPAYCQGNSETATGIALARYPRDKYFIATKLSNFAPSQWSYEESVKMFENSLKCLQTDYVDYLLLHGIGIGGMDALRGRYLDNGVFDYLKKQKSETGRIRNLGFSYHGDVEVFDYLLKRMDEGLDHWDFVQIQMNYLDWEHAKASNPRNTNADYLYEELHRRGIPVVIMEPILGGRLAKVSYPINNKMKARRPDDTPAAWAFRFAGTPEGVLTVLSGMTYMEHLKENVSTFSSLDPLTDDENEFLMRTAVEILENNEVPCTDCKYCMPCPYGVDIPGVFAHYNRCLNDDNLPRVDTDPRYAEARKAFLFGYDRAVPRLRQAGMCIGCGECVSHCPQSIPIPETMRKIDNYAEDLRNHNQA